MVSIPNPATGGNDPLPNPFVRLPAEMRAYPQWCITPGTASDKAPRTVSGAHASSTNPATWTDFDTACRGAAERGRRIGFVFTASDPFACVDLDVVNEQTQIAKGEAIEPSKWTPQVAIDRFVSIAETFDSYTEVSRSGFGLHILVKANIGPGCKRDGVELYSQERFIICTGNVWRDRPLADRQDMLANMVTQMRPSAYATAPVPDQPEKENDAAVIDRAMKATNAEKFTTLANGVWKERYGSQSEADLALLSILAFWSPNNEQCKRIFRLTELGKREKATKDDRYLNLTLERIRSRQAAELRRVQEQRATFKVIGGASECAAAEPRHFQLWRDDQLDRLPALRWLVKRIIPDAGIGAIYGDSGTFKSFLTLDLLAHISTGKQWFGRKVRPAPAVYVPFEGQGGVPNRIKAWRLAQAKLRDPDALIIAAPPNDVVSNVAIILEAMNLRNVVDRDKLVATLTESGWAGGVLCIDTLAHASNGIDENSSEMGEMIGIFRDLQRRLGGVILLVHHSGKDQSRGMRGWSGLHAAMDFVIECQRDKATGTPEAKFVLAKVKDGSDGLAVPFIMESIVVGFDEDGEAMTSLAVNALDSDLQTPDRMKPDAERDQDDDDFVWEWVHREVKRSEYPTGRSLEGQREKQMSQDRQLTQKRLRDAIHRLRAASRLVDAEDKAPSRNLYMIAVSQREGVR